MDSQLWYHFQKQGFLNPNFVLQHQVRKEIQLGTVSIFWMSFPTVVLFFWEVRGHSKLYDSISENSLGEKTVI